MSSTKQLKGFTTALDLPDLPFTKRGEGNLPQRSHMTNLEIRQAMQDATQALNDARAQLVKLQDLNSDAMKLLAESEERRIEAEKKVAEFECYVSVDDVLASDCRPKVAE